MSNEKIATLLESQIQRLSRPALVCVEYVDEDTRSLRVDDDDARFAFSTAVYELLSNSVLVGRDDDFDAVHSEIDDPFLVMYSAQQMRDAPIHSPFGWPFDVMPSNSTPIIGFTRGPRCVGLYRLDLY